MERRKTGVVGIGKKKEKKAQTLTSLDTKTVRTFQHLKTVGIVQLQILSGSAYAQMSDL